MTIPPETLLDFEASLLFFLDLSLNGLSNLYPLVLYFFFFLAPNTSPTKSSKSDMAEDHEYESQEEELDQPMINELWCEGFFLRSIDPSTTRW